MTFYIHGYDSPFAPEDIFICETDIVPKRNIEAISYNHCCSGKAATVT